MSVDVRDNICVREYVTRASVGRSSRSDGQVMTQTLGSRTRDE